MVAPAAIDAVMNVFICMYGAQTTGTIVFTQCIIVLLTYRTPGSRLLCVLVSRPSVETLLVAELAGRLDSLAEGSGRGFAVEHVTDEGVLQQDSGGFKNKYMSVQVEIFA